MGDPGVGEDFAVADEADDFREVVGEGVATGEEGEFAAVEDGGVGEGEGAGGDADVDDAAGEGGEFEAVGHGGGAAGGVDDEVCEAAVGGFEDALDVFVGIGGGEGGDGGDVVVDEVEAGLDAIEDDDVEVEEFEEFEAGEADGSCADDEGGFSGLGVSAVDGVFADGEGFDEGELVVGEVVSGVEFACGDGPCGGAEAAIGVDAEDLDAGAAV